MLPEQNFCVLSCVPQFLLLEDSPVVRLLQLPSPPDFCFNISSPSLFYSGLSVLGGFNHSDPNTHLRTSEWASSKTGDQYFLSCSGRKRSEGTPHTEERAVIKNYMQSIFERCGFFCHLTLFKKRLGMFLNYILSSLPLVLFKSSGSGSAEWI